MSDITECGSHSTWLQNGGNGRKTVSTRASCRIRLEAWVRMVASRSPIWGRVDIGAFCRVTGYSREHATRTLSKVRLECLDLAFETKLCRHRRGAPKRWGVIVAERAKLKFDRRSLFFDKAGQRLHNYTQLGQQREKLPLPQALMITNKVSKSGPGSELFLEGLCKTSSMPHSSCDTSPYGKDSFGIQRYEGYGGNRDMAHSRAGRLLESRGSRQSLLRKKAFSMMADLEVLHWDNCKVTFSSRAAFRYALGALAVGHEQMRILRCYERGLSVCHGYANDLSASQGKVVFFNVSSTISKARKMLASDGLSVPQRISLWYKNHQTKPGRKLSPHRIYEKRPSESVVAEAFPLDPMELRRRIAESLGCDLRCIGDEP